MTAGKTILREDHKRTRAATTAPHSGIVFFFLIITVLFAKNGRFPC